MVAGPGSRLRFSPFHETDDFAETSRDEEERPRLQGATNAGKTRGQPRTTAASSAPALWGWFRWEPRSGAAAHGSFLQEHPGGFCRGPEPTIPDGLGRADGTQPV